MINDLMLISGKAISQHQLDVLTLEPLDPGTERVVGVVFLDPEGRAFVQRRSLDRPLFPGCWDIVGGHTEEGETLLKALRREVQEETGWILEGELQLVARVAWSKKNQHQEIPVLEWDFLLQLEGYLEEPQVETSKIDRWLWLESQDRELLLEHRDASDDFIYKLVSHCFDLPTKTRV